MCACVRACVCTCVCAFVYIGNDYGTPFNCCFAAGEREATCNITIVSDAIAESDEMFNITLNPSSGQCICEDASIKVTIEDMQRKLAYIAQWYNRLQPTNHYPHLCPHNTCSLNTQSSMACSTESIHSTHIRILCNYG